MNMKKYIATAALIGVIGIAGVSMADSPRGYDGSGYGPCGGSRYCDNWNNSEVDDEKAAAFFEETKEIRREIVVKRSELDAMMQQDNPDEKKVAKLTGELFDLQSNLDEKAGKTFGDTPRHGFGRGPGYGNCAMRRGW